MHDVAFIPGSHPLPRRPLGRFLPPIDAAMFEDWLQQANLPHGCQVLDPFGTFPQLDIWLARLGYRVLVTVNNPILAFMLEVLASAPTPSDLQAAITELGSARRAEERMDRHVQSFYTVTCQTCNTPVEAQAFIWKRDAAAPHSALVECPFCNARSEQVLRLDDLQKLEKMPPAALHRARALERILAVGDPLRPQVAEALDSYPDRPLIILQTLINRLETLNTQPQRKKLIYALLLSACDRGNTLWAYPSERSRPRQLATPPQFREDNLWQALEDAMTSWQADGNAIPVMDLSQTPPQSGGIQLFRGRFKELPAMTDLSTIKAVISVLPRPNQAFWTLSAVWTGWLWGKEAVKPLSLALERQRYDWNWHSRALFSVIKDVSERLTGHPQMPTLIAENEPGFFLAAGAAFGLNRCKLTSFAISGDATLIQSNWQQQPVDINPPTLPDRQHIIRHALQTCLNNKFEPADYRQMHSAATLGLLAGGGLAWINESDNPVSVIQKDIETILRDQTLLKRYEGSQASLETGQYWLAHPGQWQHTLSERLETSIVQYLLKNPESTITDIRKMAYAAFPGLLTPRDDLILAILQAYGLVDEASGTHWHMHPHETAPARRADLEDLAEKLKQIAARLGYQAEGERKIIWREAHQKTRAIFFLTASTIISKYLHQTEADALHIIVMPGSRSNLLTFKLNQNPALKAALNQNWVILKYRQLRNLAANPLLTHDLFFDQIHADPPEYHTTQLALF